MNSDLAQHRLGIMGGTFDPIHKGHIMIAEYATKAFNLERVLFIPTGRPPHKREIRLAGGEERLQMCRLAVKGHPDFVVDDREVRRQGTTYTVDTMQELHKAYGPGWQFYFIIGTDTLQVIDSWRCFPQVAKMTEFIAIYRPGDEREELTRCAQRLERQYGARIHFGAYEGPDISSTQVRRRVASGGAVDEWVPDAVDCYIRTHQLYKETEDGNRTMDFDAWTARLKTILSPQRFAHTLRTRDMAVELAKRYGVDADKAQAAALLHDCAKEMERAQMLDVIEKAGMQVSGETLEFCRRNGCYGILHGPAGAAAAKIDFDVTDPEILSAIAWHTLGQPEMGMLDKVIYTADILEEGRQWPGIEEVRAAIQKDLDEGLRLCVGRGMEYLIQTNRPIHPSALALWNELNFTNH